MKIGGIYRITCRVTGEIYVGQSLNLLGRRADHFRELRKGKHPNQRLQADYFKHGSGAFVWCPVELCSAEALCEREAHHIKLLGATYNQAEPPRRIRRTSGRFNPFLQDVRRFMRRKR